MATIADQPDIEIVGEVVKDEDLNEAVEQTQPDVLILALEEPERPLGQCGFLLGRYPRMRILALGRNKIAAFITGHWSTYGIVQWRVLKLGF